MNNLTSKSLVKGLLVLTFSLTLLSFPNTSFGEGVNNDGSGASGGTPPKLPRQRLRRVTGDAYRAPNLPEPQDPASTPVTPTTPGLPSSSSNFGSVLIEEVSFQDLSMPTPSGPYLHALKKAFKRRKIQDLMNQLRSAVNGDVKKNNSEKSISTSPEKNTTFPTPPSDSTGPMPNTPPVPVVVPVLSTSEKL